MGHEELSVGNRILLTGAFTAASGLLVVGATVVVVVVLWRF